MSFNYRGWMNPQLENDGITLSKEYKDVVNIFLEFVR